MKAAHEDVIRIQAVAADAAADPGPERLSRDPPRPRRRLGAHRRHPPGDARRGEAAGVHAILLTDHHRPPKDFITDSWRGLRDGVLFVPGSEDRGFLLYPTRSIMDRMKDPTPAFIETVRADDGLIFLSHIEERPDHSMAGLDGMEIYNRHADAKKDRAGILAIMLKLTDPGVARRARGKPPPLPRRALRRAGTISGRLPRQVGRRDQDPPTHRRRRQRLPSQQVLLVKMVDERDRPNRHQRRPRRPDAPVSAALRPGIRAMTKGHKPGDMLARLDIDPYSRSFRNVSTHILAPELTEPAIRARPARGPRLRQPRLDLRPDRIPLRVARRPDRPLADHGRRTPVRPRSETARAIPRRVPHPPLERWPADRRTSRDRLEHAVTTPGVYRVEAWLEVAGEERPWFYSNPIYVR